MEHEEHTGALAELQATPWYGRLLLAIMLFGVGYGCAYAASMLATYRHWVAWLVLLLIVEPLALFSFAAVGFFIAPRTIIGHVFVFALRRVKVALIVVGAVWGVTLLWLFGYTAFEAWRTWGPGQ